MMRQLLLIGTLAGMATNAQAQAWETSAHLTGGGFNFRGASAVRESVLNLYQKSGTTGYTNNPYGALPGLSYGAALQQQRVTKGRLLLGLQAGYERLRSRVNLVLLYYPGADYLPSIGGRSGRTHLINEFVNLHPFVGRRFGLGQMLTLDVTAGADLGLLLHSQEKGRATDDQGHAVTSDLERPQPGPDVRPRLNLTTYYKRAGLSLGYSHGLTNYRRNWVGGVNEAYAQVWRLGVVYRLN